MRAGSAPLVFGIGDEFLVSGRFKEIYHDHGRSGLSGFEPVEIVRVKSGRRKRPDPPQYFRAVVVRSRTAIDLRGSGLEWLKPPTCQECRIADIVRWKRVVIDENTWTGEDIFTARGLPGTFILTQRFKDLCEENDVKNAFFIPGESYAHDFYRA